MSVHRRPVRSGCRRKLKWVQQPLRLNTTRVRISRFWLEDAQDWEAHSRRMDTVSYSIVISVLVSIWTVFVLICFSLLSTGTSSFSRSETTGDEIAGGGCMSL